MSKDNIGQVLMLIVSELSEALEAVRKNKYSDISNFEKLYHEYQVESLTDQEFVNNFNENIKDTFEDEVADALIRILDLCGGLNIDIDFQVNNKLKYNSLREYKHGKAF